MISINPEFKLRIKELRIKKGLSNNKLSQYSGVSRTYLRELEEGTHDNPTVLILLKLSRTLECSIDDLIEEKNNIKGVVILATYLISQAIAILKEI